MSRPQCFLPVVTGVEERQNGVLITCKANYTAQNVATL